MSCLNPISRDRKFDLTFCFENGVLLPAILSLLLLFGVTHSFVLARNDSLTRSPRSFRLLKAKIALLIFAALCSLASLTLALNHPTQFTWPLYTAILQLVAFTFASQLTYINHTRSRSSSSILLLFWPVYLATLLVWIRSFAMSTSITKYDLEFWLHCVTGVLGAIAFAIELAGPETRDEANEYENPIIRANIFSRWSFGWMTPLMKLGSSKYLTEEDLYNMVPKDEAANLGMRLQSTMKNHTSLWASLYAAYGGPFTLAILLKVVQDCLAFLQPQLLRWLLSYITAYQQSREGGMEDRPSPYQGFAIALLMFIAAMTQTAVLHQYFQIVFETGMRVRAGLVTAIYRKALILSSDERGGRATGDIVNLMSVDATKLQDLCTYGIILVSGPLQITLAFVSLYNLLGWPAFVGVAIMAFSIPLQTVIAKYLKTMQEVQMKNRDQRTRLMSELLGNIKSVKLYGWEPAFIKRVLRVRNDLELRMLRRIGIATAFNSALWTAVPLLVAFSSFVVAATVSSEPLTSEVIFPAISLFMLLQFPLAMFATITSSLIEAIVSVKRLSKFFQAEELQPDARRVILKTNHQEGDEVLRVQDGEFSWNRDQMESTLQGIDLTVRKGELVGILGRVGAGKTSLLSAIIGEMQRTDGDLTVYGTIAYCPQNPWIMSTSVRENILFSHAWDEEFYNLVLDACALRQDLAVLADGDMTQVGDKGITLSGGQRARISLARAVYARADLYLLDDVLAAVDSHVARHVFNHVIGPAGILATKARILVTNTVSFLKQHDQLVFLRRGIILESGTYQQILEDDTKELHKLIKGHSRILSSQSGTSTPRGDEETLVPTTPSEQETVPDTDSTVQAFIEKLNGKRSYGKAALAEVAKNLRGPTQAEGPPKEHTERGRVRSEVYKEYVKAASVPGFVLFLLCIFLRQTTQILANVTLKQWGEHNQQAGSNRGMSTYLMIYGLNTLAACLSSLIGSIALFVMCTLRSTQRLHDSMLFAVMRAPLSFFEQTSVGRILNLFSRDVYVVDQVLATYISSFFRTLSSICGILVVVGASFPGFLIAVVPLGFVNRQIMMYYLATGRELKRLDATSRSPIFSSFSETLAGLSTVRAFAQQNIFLVENQRRIDRNQMCYLLSVSVNRWLAVRLEVLGATLILISGLLSCLALVTTGVNAGLVGLVLSYGLDTTNSLNWFVRSASEVEQNVVSVERIVNQTKVTPEAPAHIEETKPAETWPSDGKVEFRSYSMRYRPELELVLKDISLTIKPREKVGICGRTGAGKSSLLLALFRIIEPSSGTITIDGVDITTLGLHELRSAISIIPQESQMFEGTMRENIDPTGMYQDSEIWTALEQAHLKSYVQELPGGLDAAVREGGSSLSAGQRQLVCFARALLRKSKILVLDEATSAIDLVTDAAVQEILRGPQFSDTTILTIAHRLNTIIESDRVLVLDEGKVAEFDSPKILLEKTDSMFASLAREAGLAVGTNH